MSVAQTIAVGLQIAEAFEAAHDKGIIHRDLKPANIKVLPNGAVKVLDFGLAKALAGDESRSDVSHLPTVTATQVTGLVMGTPAYMSPEQARGDQVDRQTDIWAFGGVLYEMLTGRLAFAGKTLPDTLAAVLADEPDWSALPGSTPAKLRDLLKRCLQKDPKRRLRDVGDAVDELVDLVNPPSDAEGRDESVVSRPVGSGDRRRPIRGRKRPAAGGEPTGTEIGDTAPDFTLPASDGQTYSLTKLRGMSSWLGSPRPSPVVEPPNAGRSGRAPNDSAVRRGLLHGQRRHS